MKNPLKMQGCYCCDNWEAYYNQEIKAFKQALEMSAKVESELAKELENLPSVNKELFDEATCSLRHMELLLESMKWLKENHNRLPFGHTIGQWIKNQEDVINARSNKLQQAISKAEGEK